MRAADGACDVADGGLEGFVEDLADWVADDAEETLGFLLVGGGGEEGERSGFYFVLVEGTVGGDVGHFGTCMCGC